MVEAAIRATTYPPHFYAITSMERERLDHAPGDTPNLTRYLVVDDSPFIRRTVTDALKFYEHDQAEITEAGDATEAVAQFIQADPEVVFLDMILPGEADGVDALRAMLSQRPNARVVLITALPEDNPDVISAMSMGAFGYLRKPIRKEDVRKILRVVEEERGGAGRIR